MKKFMKKLMAVTMSVAMVVAFVPAKSKAAEEKEINATLKVLAYNNDTTPYTLEVMFNDLTGEDESEFSVSLKEGASVYDLLMKVDEMTEGALKMEIEDGEYGKFLTSMSEKANESPYFYMSDDGLGISLSWGWGYDVNLTTPMVAMDQVILEDGDEVTFIYQETLASWDNEGGYFSEILDEPSIYEENIDFDENAFETTAIHRFFNVNTGNHTYVNTDEEYAAYIANPEYTYDGKLGALVPSTENIGAPLLLMKTEDGACTLVSSPLNSLVIAELGYDVVSIIGFEGGDVEVHGLVNPATEEYMLTSDANEIKVLTEKYGWADLGIAFALNGILR